MPGYKVRIQIKSLAQKTPTKFAPKWLLPYKVLKVQRKTVKVKNMSNGKRNYVLHEILKHSSAIAILQRSSLKDSIETYVLKENNIAVPKCKKKGTLHEVTFTDDKGS